MTARLHTTLAQWGTMENEKPLEDFLGKIHHGDCVEIMSQMPAESIKVVVTSPPYNLRNSTGNWMKAPKTSRWKNAALIGGYDDHDDMMPHEEYVAWQKECLTGMMRLLRPDGAIFYNHKWRTQNGLIQDRQDIVGDFPVRQIIIWERAGGINFNRGYFLPTYEVIYLIAKPDFVLAPKKHTIGSIWRFTQESNNDHPAPFPFQLANRCVSSVEDGVVLDPFMGSGTTALAAIINKRDWVGIELSAGYIEKAERRILYESNTLF